ncbi:tyrosyl-DNA phosphodiesterase 1-like isoform X1 [Chenopodium quinoa]|uniref:tyrosyl-DNA phosphodiesterase 1-like isoform X1 n=1 Tax=Chenopodium quinoa TaxID=63459 RepID=UPI000B78DF03|nr:tyrosyl-DNA phosphodiesterase 1-like isoform X1 [Chenopodium quinoa]
MVSSQVGILIPLNKSLEKEKSLPELPVSEGDNVIGRSNVPVTDKRLSRKHLILSASSDGCADLLVEGMNPVVVNSGGQRKVLNSGEKASVNYGDILELIPGSHYFKYVALSNQRNTDAVSKGIKGARERTNLGDGRKRAREDLNFGASAGHLTLQHRIGRNVKENIDNVSVESNRQNHSVSRNTEEALRDFHVSNDSLPSTFRLMKVQGLPEWANTSCVSIDNVIEGDVIVAVLSNYMVDIDWLLSACPMLRKVPQVLIVHGEGDGTVEYMKRNKPSDWILHKPPLPISYGTHHSKAMLLVYPQGLRVIVHSANLIHVDWNNKSQGLWMQDFPWKDQNATSKGSPFESDLIDYLQALKLPEFTASLPALGRVKINASFFKKFNYENAAVRLIASVPGYHSGSSLKKWGHMKLRSILEQCTFDDEFKKSPLIYQFSSLGSLDEKWMTELRTSMSSGLSADASTLGLGEPLIIWPTVEDVRWSLEGYAAGNAIPSPLKNVEKEFLKKYWAKWKATHTGRCRAMPHIKTFVRYNGQNLAWFLLTSSNLSKAAWGALQKNSSQLMIRSYELGVLFLPTVVKNDFGFSCTDDKSSLKNTRGPTGSCGTRKIKLVTLTWPRRDNDDSDSEIVPLPVPYELPPKLYSSQDVPWSWDRVYRQKDVYGQVWPRQVKLYSSQDA